MDFEHKLDECGAVKEDHFVYKAGTHGDLYIDKEQFPRMGAIALTELVCGIGKNAIDCGLDFKGFKKIAIIGPAYGAIPYCLTLAAYLEEQFLGRVKFIPARTEVERDKNGLRVHVIPEKLMDIYRDAGFFILEDILNNGTSVRETSDLLYGDYGLPLLGAMCFVDRGGNTAESLEIEQYYPFMRKSMSQHRAGDCLQCQAGVPINTTLGKGKIWVDLFGQPPYPLGMDFSAFWG